LKLSKSRIVQAGSIPLKQRRTSGQARKPGATTIWSSGEPLFAHTGEENSPYLPPANRLSLSGPAIGGVFFSV
jgi:hypothetical protein